MAKKTNDPGSYDPATHGPLLTPAEAKTRLREKHAVDLSLARLADLRSIGGGPAFIKPAGARGVRYPQTILDGWAQDRNRRPLLTVTPTDRILFPNEAA